MHSTTTSILLPLFLSLFAAAPVTALQLAALDPAPTEASSACKTIFKTPIPGCNDFIIGQSCSAACQFSLSTFSQKVKTACHERVGKGDSLLEELATLSLDAILCAPPPFVVAPAAVTMNSGSGNGGVVSFVLDMSSVPRPTLSPHRNNYDITTVTVSATATQIFSDYVSATAFSELSIPASLLAAAASASELVIDPHYSTSSTSKPTSRPTSKKCTNAPAPSRTNDLAIDLNPSQTTSVSHVIEGFKTASVVSSAVPVPSSSSAVAAAATVGRWGIAVAVTVVAGYWL